MIIIKKEFIEQILRQCRGEYPNETCGILAGSKGEADTSTSPSVDGECNRTVEKVYEMANADKSPETFIMEPREQLKVMKELRTLGLEMVGIYHSHLESEAYPSAHDLELAYYPEASYVIVSLKHKDSPIIRSFKIIEGKITEEEVRIADSFRQRRTRR